MNKIMQRNSCVALLLSAFTLSAVAQTTPKQEIPLTLEEREVQNARLTWGNTENAAGLALERYMQNGQTELGGYLSGGDLHRAQEGDARNGLRFKTDRYDKISDKFIVWGSFQFDMDTEKNRAWSDAITTYNNSPYLFGSAIQGDYDSQMFDFKAKLAHHTTDKLKLGVGANYLVGDVSRLRDPRTRTYLADYSILPSITYQVNENHTVGATASYRYRKDKMPNVRTVQEDPNFMYYPMVGMENGEEPRLSPGAENGNGILRGFNGFRRQFVSNFWGGELQYAYSQNQLTWITTVGLQLENQQVLGDTKRSPGEYLSDQFKVATQLFVERGNLFHQAYAKATLYRGQANEFIQSLNETRDPVTGIVSKEWVTNFVYTNQYEVESTDIEAGYKVMELDQARGGYRWYAGINGTYGTFTNQYNIPLSYLKVAQLQAVATGGVRLLKKNRHTLTLEAQAGYQASLKSDLLLNNSENDLAVNIWIPDADYYTVNQWVCKADVKYAFPIYSKKVGLSGYLRIFSHNRLTNSERFGNWLTNGIAFGIITL
ncbi:MAG: DUF6850 family outer membrane beta-barrel protein [Phocaeicola sp.]